MGRQKYSMPAKSGKPGEPHGRNMLIAEYVWIAGQSMTGDHNRKHRKQVSSHVQVVKGYFATIKNCKSYSVWSN
jgi:transcriptional enhancer factor